LAVSLLLKRGSTYNEDLFSHCDLAAAECPKIKDCPVPCVDFELVERGDVFPTYWQKDEGECFALSFRRGIDRCRVCDCYPADQLVEVPKPVRDPDAPEPKCTCDDAIPHHNKWSSLRMLRPNEEITACVCGHEP